MEECSVLVSDKKWYFTKEELDNTPSRRCGIDADKEMNYRQQASNFIRDMGRKLSITKLGINTAIVYMHRFYMFHSLSQFHRNAIAPAALFLAAKVEEQPRKLEYIINMAYMCLNRVQTKLDPTSGQYLEMAKELVFHENVLLQTLGFDVAIYHPHAYVIKCCKLVKASQELIQTSLLIASNSVYLTTMCLQYRPTVVACLCIYIACKWSNWEIPQSEEGRNWFWYLDPSVTIELLQQLTDEFLHVFDKCPSRLKNINPNDSHSPTPETRPKMIAPDNNKTEEKISFPGTSGHSRDIQKHYSHHHKQDSISSINPGSTSGKHPVPISKPSQHYSHHHRSDPKLHQSSQRHSSSSQSHNQQSKDHQRSSTGTYHHRPSGVPNKDPNLMSRETSGVTEMAQNLQETCQINQTPSDRHINNNQNPQRAPQLNNKHGYDPRQKSVEHKKEDPKNFAKLNGQDNKEVRHDLKPGKSHSMEQRNGEIRKPIDKSLPLPKPPAEIQKEKYISLMLKKSHNPTKYPEKMPHPHNVGRSNVPQGSSKVHTATKPPQQIPQRIPPPPPPPTPPPTTTTTTQVVKDTKNGNSNISPVMGDTAVDTKIEKRPRRSLFSPETPEKTPPSRKSNLKASKLFGPKVLTSPAAPVKEIKQERIPDSKVPQNPMKTLKTEESCAYESMKMLGHVPDPIQRVANYLAPANNWKNSMVNDPKIPDRTKFNLKQESIESRHSTMNGLDSVKRGSEVEFDHTVLNRLNDFPTVKKEYLSPMKSAESINALLQEPLAPMPSLLAPPMNNSEILSQHLSQQSTSNSGSKKNLNETEIQETLPNSIEQQIDVETISPVKIKSEHHKSEKKKKKEKKHKHKHKDSSKEKHKHRHKEKHREKSPAPIRITISKDKLNLSPETLSGSLDKKNSYGAGLKIKIPKEKLMMSESVQQTPLKMRISTSGAVGEILESRKRDRERDSIEGAPMKKKTTAPGVYPNFEEQQRPNEVQNGLHYPSTNNEVRETGVKGRNLNSRPTSLPKQKDQNSYYSNIDKFNPPSGNQNFYFPNYQPPAAFNSAGYLYDQALFYPQQYQQQFLMYQQSGYVMPSDGAVDMSLPPPPPNFPFPSNMTSNQGLIPPLPFNPTQKSLPRPPPPRPE